MIKKQRETEMVKRDGKRERKIYVKQRDKYGKEREVVQREMIKTEIIKRERERERYGKRERKRDVKQRGKDGKERERE